MSKRISTAQRNFVSRIGSWADSMGNGVMLFFTGTQPATAEAAFNSTGSYPLVAFTEGGAVATKEALPYSSFEVTGGTAGKKIESIKIAGMEILHSAVTLLATTALSADALITSINASPGPIKFTAALKSGSTTVVIVTAPKGTGVRLTDKQIKITRESASDVAMSVNNSAVSFTSDVYTATGDTGAGSLAFGPVTAVAGYADEGVNGVNLLNLSIQTTDGYATKEGAAWQGTAGSSAINTALASFGAAFAASFTSGTAAAGWFRYYGSMADPELTGTATTDTTKKYLRYDGTIATSGGDMTATGGTTIVYGAVHTQNTFSINVPEAQ